MPKPSQWNFWESRRRSERAVVEHHPGAPERSCRALALGRGGMQAEVVAELHGLHPGIGL